MRRALAFLAGLLFVVLFAAACNGDGDDSPTPSASPASEATASPVSEDTPVSDETPAPDETPTSDETPPPEETSETPSSSGGGFTQADREGITSALETFYEGFNTEDPSLVIASVSARVAATVSDESLHVLFDTQQQGCLDDFTVELISVDDILKSGNTASVTITASSTCMGQTAESTLATRFIFEDGAWKIDEDLIAEDFLTPVPTPATPDEPGSEP